MLPRDPSPRLKVLLQALPLMLHGPVSTRARAFLRLKCRFLSNPLACQDPVPIPPPPGSLSGLIVPAEKHHPLTPP